MDVFPVSIVGLIRSFVALAVVLWLTPVSAANGFLPCNQDNGVIIEAFDGRDCTSFTSSINLDPMTGELTVVVTQISNADFSRLRIRSNQFIDAIIINIPDGIVQTVQVVVGAGLGTTDTPNGIGAIVRVGTGTGVAVIEGLFSDGDVGLIDFNNMQQVQINGDVGQISLVQTATGPGGVWSGNDNVIDGDLLGNVFIEDSIQAGTVIDVTGSLGTSSSPIIFDANGGFYANSVFRCSEVNAQVIAGEIRGRFRTTTEFGGSGDLNGDLVLARLLENATIEIGGALTANGTIRFTPGFGTCGMNDGPIRGRVTINHENTLTPGTAWLGSVLIDTTFSIPGSGILLSP